MVAGAKDSNQAIATPLSAEDEASKRNTDCVYFLASPLTCKKGSECEYRHSEHARVNPRDCWFWLNGSCLNSKCPFRHPPLDGLLGAQPSLSAGPALPMRQPATASTHAAVQAKQAVPCIFFQKGLCLKGDKCAFLHGSNSVATKPLQVTPPAAEITGQKSAFGVPQRNVQETTLYQPNISSSNKFTDVNLVRGMSGAPQKANVAKRVVFPSRGLKDKSLSYNSTSVAPVTDGMHEAEMPDDQVISNDDQIMSDGKDPHNLYRESSPGFDVLVDDVLAEDQYFDEDQYGTGLADHEMFHDPRVYDDFERLSGQNERDEIRRSSEIMLRGTTSLEGRNDRKGDTDRISLSDLRYRLKQRKDSGLRSIVSNDHSRGSREERRSGDHRRDSRLVAPLESSLSSRLQGRIKDPRRSPARRSVTDRDTERGRKVRRTSPVKTQIRDRIGSRVQDDFEQEKNLRGYGTRREGSENGWSEFSGPKRLSELKACKSSVKDRLISGQESFSLGKRKGYGEQEQLVSNLSFEGPKPLSEILKMKKRSELNAPESGSSENKKTKETVSDENRRINEEEHKFVADVSPKNLEPDQIQPSDVLLNTNQDNLEGIITDEGMEDQNLDGFDQGEDGEEYYYEEDGGEYNLEEGENAEGEYVEEEDGDDFEKKIGGMFS